MNKKGSAFFFVAGLLLLLAGCGNSGPADTNTEIPERKWTYRNPVRAAFEIKDVSKPYNIYFKLRHTADYRYSNLFVLVRLHQQGQKAQATRYQFTLALPDGEWLGSGSGNLFSYSFPLRTRYFFAKSGKYSIEVEQNMRDNPLVEISDAGIVVSEAKK